MIIDVVTYFLVSTQKMRKYKKKYQKIWKKSKNNRSKKKILACP
jgi:uncharacterized membrane protein (DUF106 family)